MNILDKFKVNGKPMENIHLNHMYTQRKMNGNQK